MLGITEEQLQLVKVIDIHTQQFANTDAGTEQLLLTLYDYMESFKTVLEGSTTVQMDYLYQNYSGFKRFSQLLEKLAQGIAEGRVAVPNT